MEFALAHLLHVVSAALWVAAAFILTLGPSVITPNVSEDVPRTIWSGLLSKVSLWIWASIIIVWGSGIYMMFFVMGGFGSAGPHVDTMFLLALIMTLITVAEYFVSRPKFAAALASGDTETANKKLRAILRHGKIVFWLGVITLAIASYGPF